MNTKLFVGGLPYETTQAELLKLFSSAGAVFGIKLIMDKETGRSKGYAFVEMATAADAKAAMEKLNGAPIGGRKMFLSEARPQEKKDGPAVLPPTVAAPAPGFVERRSGKDRRVRPGFGSPVGSSAAPAPADRRAPPVEEKKWNSKFGFGEKKPWAEKKPFGDKKPWADKKPFGDRKPFGEKKPWGDKAPGDRKPWADRKAWADKPASGEKPAAYAKKPWSDLPAAGKKWAGKPGAGGKPGGGKKPWGPKPEGKPGGFTRRARRGSN